MPVVLLARLAVNLRFAGRGIGEKTLFYPLRKAVEVTDAGLPALGVVLDVLDEGALGFYQRFDGFEALSNDPTRLFIPMQVIRQI